MATIHKWSHKDKIYILKNVNADGTSFGGFKWPTSGPVESPNWSPEPDTNSGGLFGWPWGIGMGEGKTISNEDQWVVFTADPKEVVQVGRKVKAPRGEVIYYGDFPGAVSVLLPGLEFLTQIKAFKRGKRSVSFPDLAPPAVCRDPFGLAYSSPNDQSLSVALDHRSVAVGHLAVTKGLLSIAVATGRWQSQAVAYRERSIAVGWRSAVCEDKKSVAVSTNSGALVSVKGPGSVACVSEDDCQVEADAGGICVMAASYGWWIPKSGASLIQHWETPSGVWRVKTWSAEDFPKYHGRRLLIISGKVYLPESRTMLRPRKKSAHKKKKTPAYKLAGVLKGTTCR